MQSDAIKTMKLINLRVVKLYSTLSVLKKGCQFSTIYRYSSNFSSIKISNSFPYLYELDDFFNKAEYSDDKYLKFSSDQFCIDLMNVIENIESIEDIQFVLRTIILAAKFGNKTDATLGERIQETSLKRIQDRLSPHVEKMGADEVVSTLVALQILNVPLHHQVSQKILIRITHLLKG